MISLSLAIRLKDAGLIWHPQLHDFFAIPGTELEDRIFVVSDMMIDVRQLLGRQMITFNGAVEWSLDYILMSDAVWIPTEGQLRQLLEIELLLEDQPAVELACSVNRYHCYITYQGTNQEFEAKHASDTYGQALLFVLKKANGQKHGPGRPVA